MAQSHNDSDLKRLVVVSNRLPVVLSPDDNDGWNVQPGAGGLITALAPVLRNRGGMWIGWPGTQADDKVREALDNAADGTGYTLNAVDLPDSIIEGYYQGFANEVIWPLFHDMLSRCNFQPHYWHDYLAANRIFASTVAESTETQDYVWIHDYHLMNVAEQLKSIGVRRRTGFFLHIPFPPLDIFLRLPWRFQILRALLEFDLVGFQTARDTRNFIHCVRNLTPEVEISRSRGSFSVSHGDHVTRAGTFPIGIDFASFDEQARSSEVVHEMERSSHRLANIKMVLGIDRLDYTKGLPERIVAFQDALRRYPNLQGNITLIQVVIPSRTDVPEYRAQRESIEQLVGNVNGEFTQPGWVPIHYLYRSLEPIELLAYYRMSDVCLVTSLKDGMNLVSKEYCACNVDSDGVLILSEFAGSAAQLHRGAIMVNPNDIEGMAEAINRAITMPETERRSRMRRMRQNVRRENIFWWTDSFLRAGASKRLDDFPVSEYFMPKEPARPSLI